MARAAVVLSCLFATVAGDDGSAGAPGLLGDLKKPQQVQQPEQAQQPEQPEMKEKDFEKFMPRFVHGLARESASPKSGPDPDPAMLLAHPLSLSSESQDSGDYENYQVSDVSQAAQLEDEAANRAREALETLRQAHAAAIEGQAAGWKSAEDFASEFHDPSIDSWEKTLEQRIQLLEKFNAQPRKSILDFNATNAVELIYKVNAAAAEVEQLSKKQEEAAKNAFKKAKYAAMQQVKSMEYDARSAAKQWKQLGKKTVSAQRAAGMGENVYERHSDVMSDAAGGVDNRAENYGERLQDEVRDYFIDMEDRIMGGAGDKRGKQLLRRAKEAVHRLHEVADDVGAEAAFQEAESSAKFRAEERHWEAAHGPKAEAVSLLAVPVDGRPHLHLVILALTALLAMVAFRHRPMTQPLDIEAPPLLG